MRVKIPDVQPAASLRRGLVSGLIAALVTTCAGLAAPAGFVSPAAGARVESGQTVAVEWNLFSPSPFGFEESELLLSLDGGRTFPLRVTREIAPGARQLFWRVPALPTTRARLALRTGSGDPDSETIRLVGQEFSIVAGPRLPLEGLFRVDQEWRTSDALERPQRPAPERGSLRGKQERMVSAPARAPAMEKRPDLLPRPGPSPLVRPWPSDPVSLTCLWRPLSGPPPLTPRRE